MSKFVSVVDVVAVKCRTRDSVCGCDREKDCPYIKKLKLEHPEYTFPVISRVNETCFIHVEKAKRPTYDVENQVDESFLPPL